jgi:hypothetical protein
MHGKTAIKKTQYNVFLPNRYAIISDEDIESINSEKQWLNLIYRGKNKLGIA